MLPESLILNNRRVLFLCPSLVGAGVERRICLLANYLHSKKLPLYVGLLRKEGEFINDVPSSVLLHVDAPRRMKFCLFPLKIVPHLAHFFLAIYQIKTYLHCSRPGVVVTFTLETTLPMYVVTLFRRREDCRWIISEDSNTAAGIRRVFRFRWVRDCLYKFLGEVYRRADGVTCVSSAVRQDVRSAYGVQDRCLTTIHNPVNLDRVLQKSAVMPGLNLNADYILAVGRLVRVKRFDKLVEAFKYVNRGRDLRLVILGEGPERRRLEHLVERLNLVDCVSMPGFEENPWSFMARARMLVVSSETEGFCNVIAEAMAVGCPVVATACGGPEDIIRHGENGILVESDSRAIAEQIILLLESSSSSGMVTQAEADAVQYRPERIGAQFMRLLELMTCGRKDASGC